MPVKRATVILFFFLQCGCGTVSVSIPPVEKTAEQREGPPKKAGESKTPPSEEAVLQSALQKVQQSKLSYKIGPADLIQISVYQEPDFDRVARVSPEGVITLPLIGKVQVGGLDVPGAEDALAEKLKKYLIHPQVSILIKEYGNKIIYVFGEVARPGSIALPTEAPLSVLAAITLAGGFTQFASKDHTKVIRSVDGKSRSFEIQITAITKGGDQSKDMSLLPNDVIVVPETLF